MRSTYSGYSVLINLLKPWPTIRHQCLSTVMLLGIAVLSLAYVASTSKADDDDLLLEDDSLLEDDLLLEEDDNLLIEMDDHLPPDVQEGQAEDKSGVADTAEEQHAALFAESRYPSASTCGTCHPKQYTEWSVSQHAYSQLSPAYLSLNNKINQLANGSNGDFCLRCHNQVGANLGEDSFASNLERHPTSREGIT